MEIKNYFAQDAQGNIMPSANCYLYLPGTTTLATGLVDGNGTPISNPFLASGMGQITFGAPNGVYDLRVALGARDWTIKVQCADIVQAMDVMDSILGSHAENPTTRNNGQPLQAGDETWNSTDKQPYWWNGSSWLAMNSGAKDLELIIRDSSNPENGAGMQGYYDPIAPTFQKVTSDILNSVPINALRGIDKSAHAGIRDGTSTVDVSTNLQALIDAIASVKKGGVLIAPVGVMRAKGLILKNGVTIRGEAKNQSIIKAPDGWSGASVIDSFGFDTYKSGNTDSNTPREVGLIDIILDGNAESYGGVASATSGVVCRMAATRMQLDGLRVQGGPGMGLHTALKGLTRETTDWFRKHTPESLFRVEVFGNKNDGWVFDGPADALIEYAHIGVNGWPDNVFTSSRPSLIEPSRRVANFVANSAVEIGWMHTFGCREGFGFIGGRPSYGSGSVRLTWNLIISESCNAGVWLREGADYQGGIMEVHNNYGIDGTAQFRDDGLNLIGSISSLKVVGNATNDHGQTKVELFGQRKTIAALDIDGALGTGHGLAVGGFNNVVGTAAIHRCAGVAKDTTPSTGVLIMDEASAPKVNAKVSSCAIAAKLGANVVNVSGDLESAFGNTANFVGFEGLRIADRRFVTLKKLSGPGYASNKIIARSADIPVDSTTLKTIAIPINGIYIPDTSEIQVSLELVSGASPDVLQLTVSRGALSANLVNVFIKFAATGSGVVKINLSVA